MSKAEWNVAALKMLRLIRDLHGNSRANAQKIQHRDVDTIAGSHGNRIALAYDRIVREKLAMDPRIDIGQFSPMCLHSFQTQTYKEGSGAITPAVRCRILHNPGGTARVIHRPAPQLQVITMAVHGLMVPLIGARALAAQDAITTLLMNFSVGHTMMLVSIRLPFRWHSMVFARLRPV